MHCGVKCKLPELLSFRLTEYTVLGGQHNLYIFQRAVRLTSGLVSFGQQITGVVSRFREMMLLTELQRFARIINAGIPDIHLIEEHSQTIIVSNLEINVII